MKQPDLFHHYYLSYKRTRFYIKPKGLGKGRYGRWEWQVIYYVMLDGKAVINPVTGMPDAIPHKLTALKKIRKLNNGITREETKRECENGSAAAGGLQAEKARYWWQDQ